MIRVLYEYKQSTQQTKGMKIIKNVMTIFFTLEEGKVYDVNCTQKGRSYMTIKAGDVVELTQNEVKTMVE
ncbi:hypothetical protein ACIQZG_22035 [Lysinibacillus sp. NPDC096418]|uniref:hypothetical protein n=1 Tax=Lysinibacillus sp. NPDC096418 TaxID=3364138 RepID=UPI0038078D69